MEDAQYCGGCSDVQYYGGMPSVMRGEQSVHWRVFSTVCGYHPVLWMMFSTVEEYHQYCGWKPYYITYAVPVISLNSTGKVLFWYSLFVFLPASVISKCSERQAKLRKDPARLEVEFQWRTGCLSCTVPKSLDCLRDSRAESQTDMPADFTRVSP